VTKYLSWYYCEEHEREAFERWTRDYRLFPDYRDKEPRRLSPEERVTGWWYTREEASKLLGLTPGTIRCYAKEGKLESVNKLYEYYRGPILITKASVDAFIKRRAR
jgi:hypothetical protein